MTTESGFGGGWWKADNDFFENPFITLQSSLNYNRIDGRNFFKKKRKIYGKPTVFQNRIKSKFLEIQLFFDFP